jgi:hypothetical protein
MTILKKLSIFYRCIRNISTQRLQKKLTLQLLIKHINVQLYARKCDLESEDDIRAMFQWIENNPVSILLKICIMPN